MITVAIVAILAAVAIPNYVRYQYKVKSAEARTLLGSVVTSQESFVAEVENYGNIAAPIPPGDAGMTRRAWVKVDCPSTCSRTSPTDCTSFECIGFGSPTPVFYQYAAPHSLASGGDFAEFAAGARADLDGDGTNGSYAYRSGNRPGDLGHLPDGISNCPANVEVQQIITCSPIAF